MSVFGVILLGLGVFAFGLFWVWITENVEWFDSPDPYEQDLPIDKDDELP